MGIEFFLILSVKTAGAGSVDGGTQVQCGNEDIAFGISFGFRSLLQSPSSHLALGKVMSPSETEYIHLYNVDSKRHLIGLFS